MLNWNQSRQNAYCSDCTVQIKEGEILTNAGLVWVWEQVFEVYKVWEMLTITTKNDHQNSWKYTASIFNKFDKMCNFVITKLKQNLTVTVAYGVDSLFMKDINDQLDRRKTVFCYIFILMRTVRKLQHVLLFYSTHTELRRHHMLNLKKLKSAYLSIFFLRFCKQNHTNIHTQLSPHQALIKMQFLLTPFYQSILQDLSDWQWEQQKGVNRFTFDTV